MNIVIAIERIEVEMRNQGRLTYELSPNDASNLKNLAPGGTCVLIVEGKTAARSPDGKSVSIGTDSFDWNDMLHAIANPI